MNTVLKNARIVLRDEAILGTIGISNGLITEIDAGSTSAKDAIDCEGDYIVAGLVDIHSDSLEKHVAPRPNVVWPGFFAAIAHDADIVGVGITTIFDAVALSGGKGGNRAELFQRIITGLTEASSSGALRADHLLHIRCEVSDPDIVSRFELVGDNPLVRMISLMDHTPGQRVFTDLGTWRDYRKKGHGMTDAELDVALERAIHAHETYSTQNRQALAATARERGLVMASHDDATVENILEGFELGGTIAEFPTTLEAAQRAIGDGMAVVMGSPNLVRGGSHIGNLSTAECAIDGMLSILSSDYVPVSLLHAVVMLTQEPIGLSLPQAMATASINPAAALNLNDRGEIAIGKRADLVRMRLFNEAPVVRTVWKVGERVH